MVPAVQRLRERGGERGAADRRNAGLGLLGAVHVAVRAERRAALATLHLERLEPLGERRLVHHLAVLLQQLVVCIRQRALRVGQHAALAEGRRRRGAGRHLGAGAGAARVPVALRRRIAVGVRAACAPGAEPHLGQKRARGGVPHARVVEHDLDALDQARQAQHVAVREERAVDELVARRGTLHVHLGELLERSNATLGAGLAGHRAVQPRGAALGDDEQQRERLPLRVRHLDVARRRIEAEHGHGLPRPLAAVRRVPVVEVPVVRRGAHEAVLTDKSDVRHRRDVARVARDTRRLPGARKLVQRDRVVRCGQPGAGGRRARQRRRRPRVGQKVHGRRDALGALGSHLREMPALDPAALRRPVECVVHVAVREGGEPRRGAVRRGRHQHADDLGLLRREEQHAAVRGAERKVRCRTARVLVRALLAAGGRPALFVGGGRRGGGPQVHPGDRAALKRLRHQVVGQHAGRGGRSARSTRVNAHTVPVDRLGHVRIQRGVRREGA